MRHWGIIDTEERTPIGPVTKLKTTNIGSNKNSGSNEKFHKVMKLLSCTINTLSVSQEIPGLEHSRECLIVLEGQG